MIDPALYLTLWWSHMLGRFHYIKTVICWYGCCWWRGNVLDVDGDGEDMKNNIKVTTMMKQIDKDNRRGDRDASVIRMMLQWMIHDAKWRETLSWWQCCRNCNDGHVLLCWRMLMEGTTSSESLPSLQMKQCSRKKSQRVDSGVVPLQSKPRVLGRGTRHLHASRRNDYHQRTGWGCNNP